MGVSGASPNDSLVGRELLPGTLYAAGDRSEPSDRLVFEEQPRCDEESRLAGSCHHLDTRIESPPSWKKLSWIPIRSRPSTPRQISASNSSLASRGATALASPSRAVSGAGSALRSTLPLELSGSAASVTKTAGTMYSGRRDRRKARSSSTGAPASVATT